MSDEVPFPDSLCHRWTRGVALSISVGDAIVARRAEDGFTDAARENSDSRVQAGIHFRFAVDAGLVMGRQIGEHAVGDYLRPLR